jgi:hypothetical protein
MCKGLGTEHSFIVYIETMNLHTVSYFIKSCYIILIIVLLPPYSPTNCPSGRGRTGCKCLIIPLTPCSALLPLPVYTVIKLTVFFAIPHKFC